MPTRPDLCVVLDAVVATEPASPKLEGTLCVGVCDRSEERWWSVDLANVASARFSSTIDKNAECVWVLGEREAKTVLSGLSLGASGQHSVYGNPKVLDAFRKHYLTVRSPLAVRAGAR